MSSSHFKKQNIVFASFPLVPFLKYHTTCPPLIAGSISACTIYPFTGFHMFWYASYSFKKLEHLYDVVKIIFIFFWTSTCKLSKWTRLFNSLFMFFFPRYFLRLWKSLYCQDIKIGFCLGIWMFLKRVRTPLRKVRIKKYTFTNIDTVLTHPARDNDKSLEAKVLKKICKGKG